MQPVIPRKNGHSEGMKEMTNTTMSKCYHFYQ